MAHFVTLTAVKTLVVAARFHSPFGPTTSLLPLAKNKVSGGFSQQNKDRGPKCYACGKFGHISTNCHSKMAKGDKIKKEGEQKGSRFPRPASYGPPQPARNTFPNSKKKEPVECYYCHKKGHMKRECFKKQGDDRARENRAKNEKGLLTVSQPLVSGNHNNNDNNQAEEEVWG